MEPDIKDLQEENELLILQLHQVQEEQVPMAVVQEVLQLMALE